MAAANTNREGVFLLMRQRVFIVFLLTKGLEEYGGIFLDVVNSVEILYDICHSLVRGNLFLVCSFDVL